MRTAADVISYDDLYARWEKGNWSATALDFTEDARQWREEFTEFERTAALWNYALFFWGEDAVTDGLSPYIDAAPREEQKYFLATQQVDEARHAVFFSRFMSEVAGVGGDDVGSRLSTIEPQLTWGFRKVFDRLETMCAELRRKPTIPRLAAAVTLYHIVIEATLAQPGQHFITSYLEQRDRLPGFRAGMDKVALDEQRHIGFGVKLLSDLCREDPDCKYAVAELLREVIPFTAAVLVPPGWDRRYTEVFGFTLEQIGAEGAASLETKLRSAGLPMEDLPGPPVFSPEMEPMERAVLGQRLVYGGVLGEKTGPPRRDEQTMAALFAMLRGGLDHREAPTQPGTIQWDFPDAEPWHLVVANGDTRVAPGRVDAPTVTIECRYEDWTDLLGGREHPLKLAALRRLRPKGDLRWLWRARKMFPQ
ncbi:MAG TPA: ribonucleotide-diphosphate reductase subunit beta [Thermoleophilaceae bacterium]|jgi:ribonucleotide reductase beta subunit family protein with ferritin-like domain|nr:ribonucleotide-diphosphate reductase subunit beta [Thermoleophilaceae bacterium]